MVSMCELLPKMSFLHKGSKVKRLKYAREYQHWETNQWGMVLWSDESKFEIFGTKRRQYVRRMVGEKYKDMYIQSNVKHGGNCSDLAMYFCC